MKAYTIGLTILAILTAVTATAAVPVFLPEGQSYDETITSPSDYLGFAVGERHMTHAELTGYLRQLDRESDRMEIREYGKTHGHRPLLQLLISSPDNLARKDEIRNRHIELTNPEKSRRLDLGEMPVVVNINYGVHGNEASGPNASAVVAYHLAAALGEPVTGLLENAVILLDPCLNPDGFDRFSNWVNNYVGKNPNPDPNTLEHRESFPDGRTNYYWFDLNRDWMLLTQPESRGRMAIYHEWMPNFVLDYHEMGTHETYFFQPGVPSRNHPLTPASVFELTETLSHYFAESLDDRGSLYFSKERFDDFYMGKGSTISDLKGAIGLLFEQASSRGHVQDSPNGLLSFRFAIRNQVTTSLAVLKASRELRKDFLEHTRTFFQESLEEGRSAGISGYRFASPEDPARAKAFVEVLKTHQIEVHPIDGEPAWYIPAAQPHYRYLQALVEQRTEFEENIFYDITAWTLPLAYNLDWEELKTAPKAGEEDLPKPEFHESNLGYLIDWTGLNAPRILFDLMEEEVIVKVAMEPFTLNGEFFDYGTLFVPVSLQPEKAETIQDILHTAATEWEVGINAVSTFLTEDGIDLGSASLVRLETPRILLVVGEGVRPQEAGTVWHLIDVLHDYPVTLVTPSQLARIDLSEYTSLVMPGGWRDAYENLDIDRLRQWVDSGGTIVCLGSRKWAIKSELVALDLVDDDGGEEEPSTDEPDPERQRRPFATASDDNALNRIRGAIFRTEVDRTHPLCFGINRETLPVFAGGEDFLKPSPNRYQTPLVFAHEPLIAGYASTENLDKLAGSAAAVVESHGKGAIILFGHHPTFRAYWRGTEKLLLNALLFGPLMQASDPGAYSD